MTNPKADTTANQPGNPTAAADRERLKKQQDGVHFYYWRLQHMMDEWIDLSKPPKDPDTAPEIGMGTGKPGNKLRYDPGYYRRPGFRDLYYDGKSLTFKMHSRGTGDSKYEGSVAGFKRDLAKNWQNCMDFNSSSGVGITKLDWDPPHRYALSSLDMVIQKALKNAKEPPPPPKEPQAPQGVVIGSQMYHFLHTQTIRFGKNKGQLKPFAVKLLQDAQETVRLHNEFMARKAPEKAGLNDAEKFKTAKEGLLSTPAVPHDLETLNNNWLGAPVPPAQPIERLAKIKEQTEKLAEPATNLTEAKRELNDVVASQETILAEKKAKLDRGEALTEEEKQVVRGIQIQNTTSDAERSSLINEIETTQQKVKDWCGILQEEMKDYLDQPLAPGTPNEIKPTEIRQKLTALDAAPQGDAVKLEPVELRKRFADVKTKAEEVANQMEGPRSAVTPAG